METNGNSVFSDYSSLKNIIIPSFVTLIEFGISLFCSALETATIGEGMETIWDQTFSSCSSLKCICFWSQISSTIERAVFQVITSICYDIIETYQSETFVDLKISKGTTIDECLPPILTFKKSNTFTESSAFKKLNTLVRLNTFPESSAFTESPRNDANLTYSFILTGSISSTLVMSICNSTLSISFSVSESNYIKLMSSTTRTQLLRVRNASASTSVHSLLK